MRPTPVSPSLSCSGEPRAWTRRSRHGFRRAEQRGWITSLDLLDNTLANAAQDIIGLLFFFFCKGVSLAHGQLVVHQDPQMLLGKAVFQPVSLHCVLVPGLFLPRCRTLPFPSWNTERPLSAQFPSLVEVSLHAGKTIWCISHAPQFCIICELAEGIFLQSYRPLVKMLDSTEPSINPWCKPPQTDFQLDHLPPLASLWHWM